MQASIEQALDLDLVITRVRDITPRVRAFDLRAPERNALPMVRAGSHLQVPVPLMGGESALRHYSISSDPERRDAYEIAVLRDDMGAGGSRAVHERFVVGLRLRCGVPTNRFPLHEDARPAVLIAGGIGITPIKAMAYALKRRRGMMQLHYSARSEAELAFLDELTREFAAGLRTYRSADGQRMDIPRILRTAPQSALFYVCGPSRLIDAVLCAARASGIDPERVRHERFTAHVRTDARPVRLELRRSGMQVEVPAHQSLLDAMLEAGIDAPFACLAGICGTCAVKVLAGEPDHRDSVLSSAERTERKLMCPCVSSASSATLVLDV